MNSFIPLMSFRDLAHLCLGTNDPIADLLEYNLVWTPGSAEGFGLICEQLRKTKGSPINILLPAYFCGQSLKFLRNNEVTFKFYPVNDQLLPDFDNFDGNLLSGNLDAFVHVHFFGSQTQCKKSIDFVRSRNAVLIEDGAHILDPVLPNWSGDFVLLSPHKHFGIPKIGLMLARNSQNFDVEDQKPFYAEIFRMGGWILKQVIKKIGWSPRATAFGTKLSSASEVLSIRRPSALATRMARLSLLRKDTASKIRKENLKILQDKVSSKPYWHPIVEFMPSDTPYIVGMVCDNEEIAARRYRFLNRKRRLVMQWPDLPIEILEFSDFYQRADAMVRRTLFFALHQDLDCQKWIEEITQIMNIEGF